MNEMTTASKTADANNAKTKAQARDARLEKDFRGMLKLQDRPYCSWIATKGAPPFVEEYLLTVDLRSYVLSCADRRYRVGEIKRCTIKVTLFDSFPTAAPNIRMLSLPPVFHPDWYSKGTYSPSLEWHREISLKDWVMRMLKTLCFDPELIDADAPANYKALDWIRAHQGDASLFPSDRTALTENSDEQAQRLFDAALDFGAIIDSWGV